MEESEPIQTKKGTAKNEELHIHTATPALDAPWCEECNALLTWAILDDDAARESKERNPFFEEPHP